MMTKTMTGNATTINVTMELISLVFCSGSLGTVPAYFLFDPSSGEQVCQTLVEVVGTLGQSPWSFCFPCGVFHVHSFF